MINGSKLKRITFVAAVMITTVLENPIQAKAAEFDPVFYATVYADVAAAFGADAEALYNHYITCGQKEGRYPYAGAAPGAAVSGIIGVEAVVVPDSETTVTEQDGIVPINKLQNYTSLKRKMTDAEFQTAYNEALKIVQPLVGLDKEEQALGIMIYLRYMVDSGQMTYSTSVPNYNNAYGYLVNHVASCAGSARTAGLCLNMLGIDYEHVHENQWCRQWCRADINGVTWIVDPYAFTCMPEAYAYWHPLVDCEQ